MEACSVLDRVIQIQLVLVGRPQIPSYLLLANQSS